MVREQSTDVNELLMFQMVCPGMFRAEEGARWRVTEIRKVKGNAPCSLDVLSLIVIPAGPGDYVRHCSLSSSEFMPYESEPRVFRLDSAMNGMRCDVLPGRYGGGGSTARYGGEATPGDPSALKRAKNALQLRANNRMTDTSCTSESESEVVVNRRTDTSCTSVSVPSESEVEVFEDMGHPGRSWNSRINMTVLCFMWI